MTSVTAEKDAYFNKTVLELTQHWEQQFDDIVRSKDAERASALEALKKEVCVGEGGMRGVCYRQ